MAARKIGNRFEIRDNQIVKISNGEILPADEPLFLIRARDQLALPALREYRDLMVADGCNDYIMDLMDEMISKFEEFTFDNPDKMKQPGITRGR